VRDMFGIAQKGLEKLIGVGLGDGLVIGFVILDLGVFLDRQTVPIGHQPFHEVVGPLVIGGGKLGGIGRIEIGQVRFHLGQ
jgi:hypothetical protein